MPHKFCQKWRCCVEVSPKERNHAFQTCSGGADHLSRKPLTPLLKDIPNAILAVFVIGLRVCCFQKVEGIKWAAKLGGGYAPAGLAHGHGSKGARQLGIGRQTASSGVTRHLHTGAIISTP